MPSPPFELSSIDWKKILRGLLIALAGAVLAWVSEQLIPVLQESNEAVLLLVAAVLSAIVNAVRKWITDTRPLLRDRDRIPYR